MSGFFSKDEIIHAAFSHHPVLGVIGLATAVLTAFYTFRMVFLAFAGPERVPRDTHPHEAPLYMLTPLLVLAIGAIGAGYVGVHFAPGGFLGIIEPRGAFHRLLEPVVEPYHAAMASRSGHAAHGENHTLMYVSALLSVLGIAAAWYLYGLRRDLAERIRMAVPRLFSVLNHKYHVDEVYEAAIVGPLRTAGVTFFNIDRFVIDGILWLITAVPRSMGFLLRGLQNGAIQNYGVTMTAGLVVVVVIVWLAR
jgi:NADH-quinone oxidoreductase subunit L